MLGNLRVARELYNWDLAVLCIETCGQSIERIAAANQNPAQRDVANSSRTDSRGEGLFEPAEATLQTTLGAQPPGDDAEFLFSLDLPWDHLWDDIAQPWQPIVDYT